VHIDSSNTHEATDKINTTSGDLSEESRIQESQSAITDEPPEESNRQLKATVVHLRESINHLNKVNEELNTKYNNQREFVSLAAHELRSPIMPILGILELLEYETGQIKKKLNCKKSTLKD